jgi:putative membrane protein
MWRDGSGFGMMGDWGNWGGGWMGFPGLAWVIVLSLVILGIILLVRGSSGGGDLRGSGLRPTRGLEALEERYARGEIKRDEYLEKKQDLLG